MNTIIILVKLIFHRRYERRNAVILELIYIDATSQYRP